MRWENYVWEEDLEHFKIPWESLFQHVLFYSQISVSTHKTFPLQEDIIDKHNSKQIFNDIYIYIWSFMLKADMIRRFSQENQLKTIQYRCYTVFLCRFSRWWVLTFSYD